MREKKDRKAPRETTKQQVPRRPKLEASPQEPLAVKDFPPLNWTDVIDVLHYCTIQHRFIYQQTFPWFLSALCLWFCNWLQRALIGNTYLNTLIPVVAFACSVGVFLAALYWEAYRQQVVYRIHEFRWFSIRGVFLKMVNTTPVTPFSAIEMRQTLLDWIFDTWRVQLHCDFVRDDTIHLLPGLSFDDAAKFYRMYSREVDRQLSVSDASLNAENDWFKNNWPS
jgi:hypothetical protein